MAISSLEEILEQRRRQQATAQRNAQRSQTRGNPTRTKDDEYKPPARPSSTAPARVQKDDVYVPPKKVVAAAAPARKPIYEPVKFVPAGNSQRTKDDAASANAQPQRYVPAPYLPPGKEKDDKSSPERPRYMPVIKPFEIAPAQGMQVGLTGDRPDTGGPGLYQSDVAGAQTTGYDARTWRNERTKDDAAFPEKTQAPGWFQGWGGGGGNNVGVNAGISPAARYFANNVQDWGKVGDVAKDALGQAASGVGNFFRPNTGATNNPAWDYFGEQVRKRDEKFDAERGTMDYTNPLQGAGLGGEQTPQQRIAAIQSGEGVDLPAAIDTGKVGENVVKNIVATPGLGYVWRKTGDTLANAGDALNAFGNDVLSTRVPTPMEDGSVSNAATLGEAASSFFYSFNDTFNPYSANYNPTAAADEAKTGVAKWINAPVRPLRAFAENFQDNITEAIGATLFEVPAQEPGPLAPGLKRKDSFFDGFTDKKAPGYTAPNPVDVANAQAMAKTLLWASGPEAQQTAMDQILTKDNTITNLEQQAQLALAQSKDPALTPEQRSEATIAAADYGNQIRELKETTEFDIIDQNTNVLRTGILSMMVDPSDWLLGTVIKAAGLTSDARRLAKAANETFNASEPVVAARLATLALGPEVKRIAAAVPEMSFLDKVDTALWTPAATRAAVDAQSMYGGVSFLMKDIDTAEDAKLILQTLARQPAQLVQGIPVNLFSSAGIQNAAVDGLVKFSPGIFTEGFTKAVQKGFRSVADEVIAMPFLQAGGNIDKKELMDTVLVALKQGGARVYGIATALGEAPVGTTKAVAKMTGNGQAVIEYMDKAGKVLGTSVEMTAAGARRAAAALEAQAKTGKIANTNILKVIGDKQRQVMSAVWLNTRPGTMITNAVGGNLQMLADGNFSFKPIDEIMDHSSKFFGGGQFNSRMGGANQAEEYFGGFGLGKLRGGMASVPLTGGRVGLGEENLAARAWYGAFQRGFGKLWDRSLQSNLNPILDAVGITDPQFRKTFINTLKDLGRSGDKQGMIKAVGDLVAGNSRAFSIADLNPIFTEALTPDGLTELNQILRASTPQAIDAARQQITELITRESGRWENYLLTDAPAPRRHAWSALEVTQDGGDIMRDAKKAIAAGADPNTTMQQAQSIVEAQKQVQQQMETLTKLVTDAGDPKQRYILYNIWADMYDAKSAVRMQQAQLAEEIQEIGGAAWKQQYYPQVAKLWEEYNGQAQEILASAQKMLTQGGETPRYDTWSKLQAQAERTLADLTATMQMEPGAGKFDSRLKQTIEAGRAIEDKAVARTYAAARRYNVDDAMDIIVSAERDSQIFGRQASAYLQQTFDEVVAPALKKGDRKALDAAYKKYYQIRNQVWREVRDSQYERWESATRQIVQAGVGQGLGQGMKFDLGGTMGPVTLVGPGTGKNKGLWGVLTEDGQMHYLPAENAKKTTGVVTSEQFFVPEEAIKRYGNLKQETDLTVAMEMDNLSSAEVAMRNAPPPRQVQSAPVRAPGAPTATETAYKSMDARSVERRWEASGATTPLPGGLPAAPAPQRAVTLNDLRAMAKESGIATSQAAGRPLNQWLINAINKDRKTEGLSVITWDDLRNDPALRADAAKLLQGRKTPLLSAGDLAKEQKAGITEARNALRSEWDRVAVGEWQLPKLDTIVMQYQRGGVVNVPDQMFSDLYGNVIAGRRIDSQKDVESLIAEYAQMKRQADKATATVQQAGAYSKLDRAQIIEQRGVDLAAAGYTDADLARMNRREVITALEAIDDVTPDELGVVGYDGAFGGPDSVRLWSEGKKENLLNIGNLKNDDAATMHAVVDDLTNRVGGSGNYAHWTMSDAATRNLDVLRSLERTLNEKLEDILAYAPAALNPNQQLQFMNGFMRKVLPDFDNAALAAGKFGDAMQSFTMVDFTKNYHVDNLLAAAGVPYHFWYSRSIKNALERAIFNPGVYSKLAQEQRLQGVENKQAGVAPRDEGTIPITIGGQEYRMRTGANRFIPYLPLFIQNDYANPEETNNAYSFAVESSKMANFGPNPMWDLISKVANGQTDQIDIAGLTPLTKLARDAAQYAGVDLPKWLDRPNNEYLIGREASRMAGEKFVVNGKVVTENEAKMVQDYARQQELGEAPLPEQAAMMKRIEAIYNAASGRVGGEKGMNDVTGFLTNTPVYGQYEADRNATEANSEYYGRQYGPQNQFGSMEAARAVDQSPSWRTRKDVTEPDNMRPGVSAVNDLLAAEKKTIFAEMNAATEAYLAKNPDATREDLYKLQSPFYDRVDAAQAKYPSAEAYEGSGQPPKGANPKERALWELNRMLYNAPDDPKPTYPDGGTDEELKAYYAEFSAWEAKRIDLLEDNLAGLLRLDPTEQADVNFWKPELIKLIKNEYASELLRDFKNRFSGPTYKGWDDKLSLKEEITAAEWDSREANVLARATPEAAALLEEYFALEKGEPRAAFKKANPEIEVAMIAMFNPENYDEVEQKFGANAWDIYEGAPKGPGFDAPEAEKQAYYAALDKYAAQHPEYTAIDMYVGGRTRAYNPDAKQKYYDWGKDYEEAIRIFGPDIFEIAANYNPDAGKEAVGAYYDAHPQLSGYWEWLKAKKNELATITPEAEVGAGIDPATYTGERPVGSGRVPVSDDQGRPGEGGGAFFGGFGGATPAASEFTSSPTVGAAMPTTTQAGPSAQQEADEDLTWQQWAGKNEKYAANAAFGTNWDEYNALKGDNAARAAYMKAHPEFADMYASKYSKGEKWWENYTGKGKGSGDFKAASNYIATNFTPEQNAQWKAYYALPDAQREAYKLAHPEIRVMTMAGYNPTEYEQAAELFGDDAWTEWANIPAYADTPEAKAARAAYLEEHPQAKLLSAWLNGRPSNFDESRVGDDFAYNFGEDFAQAQEMFGEDIWSIWAGYSSGWDKATKKAYHNQYPKLGEMMDWWYGNEGGQTRGGYSGGRSGGYSGGGGGRSGGYSGGGGGYSGWGGGDDGYSPPVDLNMPYLQNEGLSRELQVEAPQVGQQRRNFSPDWWLKAGDRVGPEKMQRWRPQKQPY
jgi:hypothetical protein